MTQISVSQILPNPEQPRTVFDDKELQELANSIRVHGVILPITVEQSGEFYILEDGERRWRAAKSAGLETIPAVVNPARNGDGTRLRFERALVANIQRVDMNPIDEARAYARLRHEFGLTVRQIWQRVGKSEPLINGRLALLETDPEIQVLFAEGKLPITPAVSKALMEIPDRRSRIALAEKISARKLSVKGAIKAAQKVAAQLKSAEPSLSAGVPAFQLVSPHNPTGAKAPLRWDH